MCLVLSDQYLYTFTPNLLERRKVIGHNLKAGRLVCGLEWALSRISHRHELPSPEIKRITTSECMDVRLPEVNKTSKRQRA